MRYKFFFHNDRSETETVTANFYTTDKFFVTFFLKTMDEEFPVASYKTKTVKKVKIINEE